MPIPPRCQFHQDAHSTGATRGELNSLQVAPLPTPDSRFPNPSWEGLGVGSDSRLPTPDSRLPTQMSRFGNLLLTSIEDAMKPLIIG
ncbi:MAG: hypothetical protein F6K50_40285 [Moorea sp. SIO3I7]|uniref:hypothetical protein n=1 Tax=Moorena sp. SIO3I8 TaxID=2607833 RepID=UPI0013C0A212|nr:hypothetical protein [Moorena sp. SIO3I8]NEO01417.1 hypothetical protein [Moorena sp. SIO3I7]NEO08737.1 hypothetical protein [Moorena sp. SIO3I8]